MPAAVASEIADAASSSHLHLDDLHIDPDVALRVTQYWRHYNVVVQQAVDNLVDLHRNTFVSEDFKLLDAFLDLPAEAPLDERSSGLTVADLFACERRDLHRNIVAEHTSRCSIVDAYNTPFDYVPTLPSLFCCSVQIHGIISEFMFC